MPMEWKQNWASHTKQLYIERIFKGRGFDRRAINLVSFLKNCFFELNISIFLLKSCMNIRIRVALVLVLVLLIK